MTTPSTAPSPTCPRGSRLVNLNDLAATVVPAVLADRVRQLGLPALGARSVGRCARLPVRAALPRLGPRRLPLRDGHLLLLSDLSGYVSLFPFSPPCCAPRSSSARPAQRGSTAPCRWPQSVTLRSAPHCWQSPAQSGRHSGAAGKASTTASLAMASKGTRSSGSTA